MLASMQRILGSSSSGRADTNEESPGFAGAFLFPARRIQIPDIRHGPSSSLPTVIVRSLLGPTRPA